MIFTCDSLHRQVLVVKAHQHIVCEGGHNRVIMLHNYPPVKWDEQEPEIFHSVINGRCNALHRQMLVKAH